MAKKRDRCPVCGGELKPRCVTYTKEHNGKLVAIGNVPAEVCQKCGEEYFAPQVVDELHRLIKAESWSETLSIPYIEMGLRV
jgi:YgiT-type zinc finger domain-containing protein